MSPHADTIRPRALAWRGRVPVAGLVVADGPRARALLLARWTPAATVWRVVGAWIVRDAAPPAHLRVESLPGDALVPVSFAGGELLSAAPLTARELAALAAQGARAGDVVRVVGGAVVVHRLSPADAEDLAAWVDVGPVDVVETTSLGAPPPPVEVAEEVAGTARGVLKGVTAASGQALAKALSSARDAIVRGGGEAAAPLSSKAAAMVGAMAMAVAWLQRKLAPDEDLPPPRTDPSPRPLPAPYRPREPSAFERFLAQLMARLDDVMAQLTLRSVLGERTARYLDDLITSFERGDLMEALRRAIPLGGAGDGTSGPLRLPAPRAKLDITHGAAKGGSLGLSPGLYERLKALYVRAADRLEAEGRYEEAAFVLAELLRDPAAAVSLLERNGLRERAAELAESAKLAPEVVVRQWLVAGRRDRAVAFARRTRSFDVAVPKLEASEPALGLSLRAEWAELLAASGDLARAVEIAWASPELRPLAEPWVDALLARGGAGAARMLARLLALRPERLDDVLAALDALAADPSPDAARRLATFAESLLSLPRGGAVSAAARAAARAVVARGPSGHVANSHPLAEKLAAFANAPALRADLPAWVEPVRPTLSARVNATVHTVSPEDVGGHPVWDAALLPDGRACLAMGEAGVWVLARDGRVLARLDAPAVGLVVSDHGDRCLAVAPRGEATRVTRVDLASLSARPWGDLRLDAWADTSDGEVWYAASGDEVLQLDLLAERPRALQRMLRLPRGMTVGAMHRAPTSLAFHAVGESPEVWAYELPKWTLRARRGAAIADANYAGIDAAGTRVGVARGPRRELRLYDPVMRTVEVGLHGGAPARVEMTAAWGALVEAERGRAVVTLFDRTALRPRWMCDLRGAARACVRLSDEHLVVGDDRGRVLAVDLRTGDVVRDLRVSGR
ncbi:MAG: bpX6 domain-containing protein [Polyangiales bacterium]